MRSQNVGQFYDFLKSVKDDDGLLVKYGNMIWQHFFGHIFLSRFFHLLKFHW